MSLYLVEGKSLGFGVKPSRSSVCHSCCPWASCSVSLSLGFFILKYGEKTHGSQACLEDQIGVCLETTRRLSDRQLLFFSPSPGALPLGMRSGGICMSGDEKLSLPLAKQLSLTVCTEKEKDPKYWRDQAQQTLKYALRLQNLNTNVAKNVIMFLGDGEA